MPLPSSLPPPTLPSTNSSKRSYNPLSLIGPRPQQNNPPLLNENSPHNADWPKSTSPSKTHRSCLQPPPNCIPLLHPLDILKLLDRYPLSHKCTRLLTRVRTWSKNTPTPSTESVTTADDLVTSPRTAETESVVGATSPDISLATA